MTTLRFLSVFLSCCWVNHSNAWSIIRYRLTSARHATSTPAAVATTARTHARTKSSLVPPLLLHLSAHAISDSGEMFAENAITVAEAVKEIKGQTLVVKYGGNAMTSEDLKAKFCQDVAVLQNLGARVVVVHGGGPQINAMLEKVGVASRFEGGMRVSSPEVVEVAEMVLCGSVNKEISSKICASGGRAIGLSGRDASLLQCTKQPPNKDGHDLGFVGKVEVVNTQFLNELLDAGICPVISPIGTGMNDESTVAYNINADAAAGRIAGELRASRVLFLTDISGVLDKEKRLLSALTMAKVDALIADETITGGMIPKVSFATNAISLGVKGAFITDGRVPHALIREVLGGGASGLGSGGGGTIITA